VGGSDRPWCALVNCLSVADRIGGVGRHLTEDQRIDASLRGLESYDVPRERSLRWALALSGQRLPPVTDPKVGDITLDAYQIQTVNEMLCAGGVMALSCGLGKTAVAVRAALQACPHTKRLWICCPINAFSTWRRWLPFLQAHFTEVRIISIDSLHKAYPSADEGGVVIFDEVHLLGVTKAQRTDHAHRIRRAFDVGFCLTGTLMHGGIEKVLSIRDLAVPGLAQFANRWECGSYFNCLVKKDLGGRKVTSLARPCGPNKEAFFKWMTFGCVSLNRHSEAVKACVQMPNQTLHTINLGEPWEPLHELAAQVALAMLEKDGKLPDAAKVAHHLCRFGIEAKVTWVLEAMADNDEAVVISAEYQESLDTIDAALTEAGVTFVRVDGGVTGNHRQEALRKFQTGEVRVFLGQMDAATTSLDLDRACISVGMDHTWKAANYDQLLGRTLRRTQVRECHHFDLAANSLQAKVITRIQEQMDFDASLAEWADIKRTLDTL
jgi:hypothetical protein